MWGDQVLLCRRNIEPRFGLWTLPAGFMELGETVEQGAARETVEEAGAHFEMQELFSVLSVVRVGQVHLYFRARLLDTAFAPGPETIEARLFREDEIRGTSWRFAPCARRCGTSSPTTGAEHSTCTAATWLDGPGPRPRETRAEDALKNALENALRKSPGDKR